MKKEKKVLTTSQLKHRYSVLSKALYGGTYLAPVVPAVVITAVNWEEWFVNAGASLPLGFVSLLLSLIVTIFAFAKKDTVLEGKMSPLYAVLLIMAIWAVTFSFLASIFNEIGRMLLWTLAGVFAGATSDQINKSVVKPRLAEYQSLVDEFALDKKAQKRKERLEKAKAEAEARQATE